MIVDHWSMQNLFKSAQKQKTVFEIPFFIQNFFWSISAQKLKVFWKYIRYELVDFCGSFPTVSVLQKKRPNLPNLYEVLNWGRRLTMWHFDNFETLHFLLIKTHWDRKAGFLRRWLLSHFLSIFTARDKENLGKIAKKPSLLKKTDQEFK